jgi:hypothetical protein
MIKDKTTKKKSINMNFFRITSPIILLVIAQSLFAQSGYEVTLTGPEEIVTGSTDQYEVEWTYYGYPSSPPSGGTYSWTVYGGTAYSTGDTYAYIGWNESGSVIYEYYYSGYTYYARLDVYDNSCAQRPNLSFSIESDLCAPRTLSYTGSPPSGEIWYWQTSSTGTSKANPTASREIYQPGTYYVRPFNTNSNCWGSESISFNVSSVNQVPQTPNGLYTSDEACGSKALFHDTPPSGIDWFWQGTNPNGQNTDNPETGLAQESGTYYLRARNRSTQCWSTNSASIQVEVNEIPDKPNIPQFTTNQCGPKELTKVGTPDTDVAWYWQGMNSNGMDYTSNEATTETFLAEESGQYYLRSKHNNGCWSTGSASVDIDINKVPPDPNIPIASTNTCGSKSLSFSGNPIDDGPTIDWYWQGENPDGKSLTDGTNNYEVHVDGTYYIRAYDNEGECWSTNSASKQVFVNEIPDPPNGPIVPDNCGPKVLSKNGDASEVNNWFWQGSNEFGTDNSSSVAVADNYEVSLSGTYYIRSFISNSSGGCWSTPTQASVTINDFPSEPEPELMSLSDDDCGSKALLHENPYSEVDWFWQGTDPNGTNTDNPGAGLAQESGTYYLRAQDNASKCWSINSTPLDVIVNQYPNEPNYPDVSDNTCGPKTLTITDIPIDGSTWYWQGLNNNGKDNTSDEAIGDTYTANETGIYYLRALSPEGCWGPSRSIPVEVYIPLTPDVPADVVTYNVTTNSFDLKWRISSNAKEYIIDVSNDETFNMIDLSINSTTNNISIENINLLERRYVRVKSINDCVISGHSTKVSVQYIPNNYNYIWETIIREEGITTESQITSSNKSESITYFDGLGRPMQKVNKEVSTYNRYDMVQPIFYDEFGRESEQYLPYVSSEQNGYYKEGLVDKHDENYNSSDQYTFYNSSSNTVAQSLNPYSEVIYEASPLNRVLEQGAPGEEFQPMGTGHNDDNNKSTKFEYTTNTENEVINWQYINSTNTREIGTVEKIVGSEYYDYSDDDGDGIYEGQLSVVVTYDEHNKETREYTDKQGNVVLKKVQENNSGAPLSYASTQYIYDDFGSLRIVLPPEAYEAAQSLNTLDQNFINKWCFAYVYDGRKRMTRKKVPGAEWVEMIYDDRDRLALTQDGEQAEEGKWMFTKYDALNRPVMTGKVSYNNRTAAEQALNTFYSGVENTGSKYYESRSSTGTQGYDNTSFPELTLNDEVHTVTYYDDYDVLNESHFNSVAPSADDFDYETGITGYTDNDADLWTSMKGQVTATKTLLYDIGAGDQYIHTVTYYDWKYRPIQIRSTNQFGGLNVVHNLYDFVGNLTHSREVYSVDAGGNEQYVINKEYIYDHADRLLEVYHQIGDDGENVLVLQNKYNELGELIEKNLHAGNVNEPDNTNYLQSLDYRYNIRGWLQSINTPTTRPDATINPDDNSQIDDAFGMELLYTNPTLND